MKLKDIRLHVKAAGEADGLKEGEILAYFSVFGNVDSYGDVVKKGAFKNTLAQWKDSGREIPLLWGHNMHDPNFFLGGLKADDLEEDNKGLKGKASFDLENPTSAQVYRLVKSGRVNELSFAFDEVQTRRYQDDDTDRPDGAYQELQEVKLYEVSVVPFGANPETEVLAVKSALSALTNGSVSKRSDSTLYDQARGILVSAVEDLDRLREKSVDSSAHGSSAKSSAFDASDPLISRLKYVELSGD